jgi:Protein of unknown function (DUF2442)
MAKLIPFRKVSELRVLDERRIWFRFDDGREGIRDFSDMLEEGGEMVEPLRDPAVFKGAYVSEDGVPAWPNGYEIDAINLYMEMDTAGLLGPRPKYPPVIVSADEICKIGVDHDGVPFIEFHMGGGRVARVVFGLDDAQQFLTTWSDVVDRAEGLRNQGDGEPLADVIRRFREMASRAGAREGEMDQDREER